MTKWIAYFMLVLIYGSVFMFMDIAVSEVSPLELVVIRMGIAALCLYGVMRLQGVRIPMDARNLRAFIIIGLFNITIPIVLIAWAQQQNVNSGLVGVLIATNPLFTLLIAHFTFADERMNLPKIIGVVLGFTGALILAMRNWEDGQIDFTGLLAQGLIIFSSFLFAAMSVYSRRVMQGNVAPMAIATMTSVVGLVSSALLLAFSYALGQPMLHFAALRTDTLLSLLVLGVVSSFLAFALSYYVISQIGSTRTSTITYLIPIISLTLGAVFLGEVIDGKVILGTVVILGGIAVVNLGEQIVKLIRQRRLLLKAAQ